jgi:DNA helicase HerA-like ATPase
MTGLRISRDLALPAEAITQTFAILAKRGVGKTYTASVMTEEMLKQQLPVVVCDPIGVWWGLRSSATGKSAGLPIVVLGGDHGDAPLEETAGSVIADLVVDDRVSLVLDLSLFRKAGQVRFMTDFAEQLYRRNRQPLHLMLDEADAFAPQRPQKGAEAAPAASG